MEHAQVALDSRPLGVIIKNSGRTAIFDSEFASKLHNTDGEISPLDVIVERFLAMCRLENRRKCGINAEDDLGLDIETNTQKFSD